MDNIIQSYTTFIYDLIKNNKITDKKEFHSPTVPDLTIEKYIDRISRYLHIEKNEEYYVLTFSMQYIYRIRNSITIDNISIYNIIITSILVSYKFICDDTYTNNYCSLIGGISLQELNKFEIILIKLLDWNLNVELCLL